MRPLLYIPLMLMMPLILEAGPVLFTGTPADDSTLPNTPASPKIAGILINFDSLPSCGTFPPSGCTNYSGNTFAGGVTITSPDGLYAIPYSAQSAPNELFDDSADGSANISIQLAGGETAIGVGIADSDTVPSSGLPVTIDLQALNSVGVGFGTLFAVTLPETGGNPFNGYFVIEDSTPDIYGLQITQPVGNTDFSGLAIDDVQVSPEPSTLLLLIGGVAMIGSYRLRKRRA